MPARRRNVRVAIIDVIRPTRTVCSLENRTTPDVFIRPIEIPDRAERQFRQFGITAVFVLVHPKTLTETVYVPGQFVDDEIVYERICVDIIHIAYIRICEVVCVQSGLKIIDERLDIRLLFGRDVFWLRIFVHQMHVALRMAYRRKLCLPTVVPIPVIAFQDITAGHINT